MPHTRFFTAPAALLAALCAVVGGGCDLSPQCEENTDLVDGEAWTFVEPADDTLWPAPPDAALCTAEDLQVQPFGEDLALEVDTRFGCGWATAVQPLALGISAGDALQVRVFYFSQATFPAARAEVAIAIGDEVVMQEFVDIPTSSGLVAPTLTVATDAPAGTPVHFHVGNHGDNSWNLVELSVVTQAPCEPEPS